VGKIVILNKLQTMGFMRLILLVSSLIISQTPGVTIEDRSHYSKVFGKTRNFRVFLPQDYSTSGKRYPVLYWFHGSGGSSTQETYRKDFEEYVSNRDLIIVNVDGSTESGSTWDYALAFEYETRTQEGRAASPACIFRYISGN
jgi:poly(3-hydroxybutyrate) depolymerase